LEVGGHRRNARGVHAESDAGEGTEALALAHAEQRALATEPAAKHVGGFGHEIGRGLRACEGPEQLAENGRDWKLARSSAGRLGAGWHDLVPLHGGHGEDEPPSRCSRVRRRTRSGPGEASRLYLWAIQKPRGVSSTPSAAQHGARTTDHPTFAAKAGNSGHLARARVPAH